MGEFSLDLPSDLLSILHRFATVFQVPIGLPPPLSQDHTIPLKQGVSTVKVKPYRYPFAQKAKIEHMVNAMLYQGII